MDGQGGHLLWNHIHIVGYLFHFFEEFLQENARTYKEERKKSEKREERRNGGREDL